MNNRYVMHKKTLLALAVIAVLGNGCWQKSLHSFYRVEDLAPDERLVGVWKGANAEQDTKERWIFKQAGPQSYELEIRDTDDKTYLFTAHLFKFEQQRFLDLTPREPQLSGIPAHHLFKVGELTATLRLELLNPEWIANWLRKHASSLAHKRVSYPEPGNGDDNEEFILLAETKDLQKFLREHLNEPDLFGHPEVMNRVGDVAAK